MHCHGEMPAPYLAAVIQLNCGADVNQNWDDARALVLRAAAAGARLVVTPENTGFFGLHEDKVRGAETLDGITCGRFAELAKQCGIYLLLGSINERSPHSARCYNTSVLFGPDGSRVAVYRKIHLFDVEFADGERFAESDTVLPGAEVVVADTSLGRIGLSICYDVRFPELYGLLRARGAQLLAVPAAFTLNTGRDHWYPLLRARAIEQQCYVLAAAQWGTHDDRGLRESYGHAMIVDPWGQVLASVADGTGFALAEIDLGRVVQVRERMPVWSHRKLATSGPAGTDRPV